MSKKKQIVLIYFMLAAVTLIAFGQVYQCDFINYDDPLYVTENIHIQDGITSGAIRWAFTTGYGANWHPLTWMSHMLDVQFFGLKAGWHHLTNLLLHLANTLLLFFVFNRMTNAPWQSAFLAALFAVHPLHVQSVAWVAERKDVLSTFFWMLTMGAYVHYVERPRVGRYLVVFAFLALGLIAKPMLVTLPFVFLLLDYWPLKRFEENQPHGEVHSEAGKPLSADRRKGKASKRVAVRAAVKEVKPADHNYQWAFIRPLIFEKIPFFALAALSSIITFVVQQKGGAVMTLKAVSPGARIANAFVAYIIYIGKTIWPINLAVYYPHPGSRPLWETLGALFLLIALTVTVIRTSKRFPYLAMGWFWFIGTLVPVIGIVQVGGHAVADRYTYIPLIGLFVMAAWGVPELLKEWRYRKEVVVISSSLVLSCLFIVTWIQLGNWKDDITLYDHTLSTTSRNDIILTNRGNAYFEMGNYGRAIEDFNRAIEISPRDSDAFTNRGEAYGKLGNYKQAIEDLDRAIEINPKSSEAYNNRAKAYGKLENYKQAISDLGRAVELNPELSEAYYNLGVAYYRTGSDRQAIENFDRAIQINPKYANAYNNRGNIHSILGNHRLAIEDFDRAIEINPGLASLYLSRGNCYGELGNNRQEIEDLQKAARLGNEAARNSLKSRGVSW